MDDLVFSVSELNTYVQRSLQSDRLLRSLRVRGEVSNFKRYSSGHCYFTLKDERCRIQCVWFASSQRGSLSFLQDGAKIRAMGAAGLYPRDGQFQFVVESASVEGVGMWHMQLAAIVERLRADGLLDPSRKRDLPLMPSCVGVITSDKGAAVRDVIRVARRRMPWVHILIYPVQVQGDDAPDQLVSALRYFSDTRKADVVILGRGGGSVEDLWAFNEEKVARAVAACSVPVISAVGHETDVALTDLVADVRAATPSMAAELAVCDAAALQNALRETRLDLDRVMDRVMERYVIHLQRRHRLLQLVSPERVFERELLRIHHQRDRMTMMMDSGLQRETARMNRTRMALRAYSPSRILDRGYAMVRLENGRTLRQLKDVEAGDALTVYFAQGSLRVHVEEKSEETYEKE